MEQKEKNLKSDKISFDYNKKEVDNLAKNKSDIKDFIRIAFYMVIAFAVGGAGLTILFRSKGELISIVGGFVLIGIAVSAIYKIIENE